jgi:hypothetical protein
MQHPTWPIEWAPHMIFMAHADWMQTGDLHWLAPRYEALKSKLLSDRVSPDGLITSTPAQTNRGDIVDWPACERDGFVFTSVNTVVNAFYLRSLVLMADLARALNNTADAQEFAARYQTALTAFQRKLFDPAHNLYRDGEGTDHASLHANLFPLAFGLVSGAQRTQVASWLGARGMACSVYGAQYLLEGLFENDGDATALSLITAPGDRSWRHMVESGAPSPGKPGISITSRIRTGTTPGARRLPISFPATSWAPNRSRRVGAGPSSVPTPEDWPSPME